MEISNDLTGKVFGRLTVKEIDPTAKSISWICVCECGVEKTYMRCTLLRGRAKSCGCLAKEKLHLRNSHNHTIEGKSRTYNSWQNMKARCYQSSSPSYKDYGAKGITVCESWLGSFEAFLADMGERPENMTLDRIDVNKGYAKENCRWASINVQMNNTTRNKYITFNGKTQTLTQWSRELGFSRKLIGSRIREKGWSIEKALTTPLDVKRSHKNIKTKTLQY